MSLPVISDKYHKITSLKLNEDNYLFLDMFCRNNELILIIPGTIDFSKLKIYNGEEELYLKQKKYNYHGFLFKVIIYDLITKEINIDIKIEYNNDIIRHFSIQNFNFYKEKNLCLTTLFKDDYFLLNKFVNYYKKNGVENFFLYYNGKIDNLPTKNMEDVIFIEWNYPYLVDTNKAFAQNSQTLHSLYKYGIPLTDYIIYNDLDEYFFINENCKIVDIINENPDIDTFYFHNVWADTIEIPKNIEDYFLELENNPNLPDTFYIDLTVKNKGDRSKFIVKTNSIYNIVNIHSVEFYCDSEFKELINKDFLMFHFFRWAPEKNKNNLSVRGRNSLTRNRYDHLIEFNKFKKFSMPNLS